MHEEYIDLNRKAWNKKTELHIDSKFYNNLAFLEGRQTLPQIDLQLLGNIENLSILHLQCHFGQDTISLSRLGAKATGIDLSDNAISKAKEYSNICNTDTEFICSDLYSLKEKLNETFDVVYTSYGTIGWLPDINKWAETVSHFLKPGGRFVFVEFHPVVWMFDNEFDHIEYPYFKDAAIVETEKGSYADRNSEEEISTITWNHGLGEVMQALIDSGISIETFKEYDYSPYDCMHGMIEKEENKYVIEKFGNKIPLLYSITGRKR